LRIWQKPTGNGNRHSVNEQGDPQVGESRVPDKISGIRTKTAKVGTSK
jgi:hypothetical protein